MSAHRDPVCGMMVDESSGLKLSWQGGDYFFCSEGCRRKFVERNKIEGVHHAAGKISWWKSKIVLMSVIYIGIFSFGLIFDFLAPLRNSLLAYLRLISFPIVLGLFLGGVIDWLVPYEYISKLFAQNKKRTIIYSAFGGFLLSTCSHGILALAIQFYKKGAPPPAVVAFLLASPWANLPLTILMFGLFGGKAFFVIVSAVIIALITGYIFMFLESRSLIEHNPYTVPVNEDFSITKDATARIKNIRFSPSRIIGGIGAIWQGSAALANMVLWWVMFGMLLASLAGAYLPPHFMHQYMGPTFFGIMVTLFVATIMEVCSEGTAPLAFEIYRQTGALGNSFVFLMAGVVTDYTEIGLLWSNIGWRTALWLPVITVPQVLLLGILANFFFK